MMRERTVEVVRVTGVQDIAFAIDREFEAPADHDASFFARMPQSHLSSVGTRLEMLVQNLDASVGNLMTYLAERDLATGDLDEFLTSIDDGRCGLRDFLSEKVREVHRDPLEDPLQDGHGGIELARLDQRDRRVADAGSLCEGSL
jgi:hypothetical protein